MGAVKEVNVNNRNVIVGAAVVVLAVVAAYFLFLSEDTAPVQPASPPMTTAPKT